MEVAYKKLKDKQQLYKSFLSHLPHPIVIVNQNLRISYCNLNFLNSIEEKNLRRINLIEESIVILILVQVQRKYCQDLIKIKKFHTQPLSQ